MDKDLQDVLAACKKAAEAGFKIAKQNNAELGNSAKLFASEISSLESRTKGTEAKVPEYLEQFLTSCKDYQGELVRLYKDVERDLDDQKSNLALFNVVVFGRTMAGKSTLMETLTRGKGDSIGKGAQRTTLDVRGYTWNGLQIYDTPGIAAAATEGREDEAVAYHAAKYADMMVFLFANDAPKQPEAAAFVELKKMGKSIIVLINVKRHIPQGKLSPLTLRELQEDITSPDLDTLRDTFLQMVERQGGQEHKHVQFIYANLHAAFLSQQEEYREYAETLRNCSNIQLVEEAIINEIRRKGSFFQYKNFVDCTYKEVWEVTQHLREQARGCSIVIDSFKNALERMGKIRERFVRDSERRIDDFIQNVDSTLRNNARGFAREYYDCRDAGDYWEDAVKSLHIDQLAGDILSEIGENCQQILEEFAKEFDRQLSITQRVRCDGIQGVKIVDVRGMTRIAMGVLAIAGAFLGGPIGIAIGIISFLGGIFSGLFTSREEKIRKAINKLETALMRNIDEIVSSLRKSMINAFNDKILRDFFDKVRNQFTGMADNLYRFQDLELKTVRKLNQNLLIMNKQILDAATEHLHLDELKARTVKMARIPGRAVLICVNGENIQDPDLTRGLGELLQEEVILTTQTTARSLLADYLHVDMSCVTVNGNEYTLTNPGDDIYRQVERYGNLVEQLTDCTLILAGKKPEWRAPEEHIATESGSQGMNATPGVKPREILEGYDPDADLEDPMVQWDIAKHYANGDMPSLAQNWADALKWAEKAARQGHGKAASLVGDCHYFGLGTELDYKEAMLWYEMALDKNYYPAGKYLGDCYYFGLGTNVNFDEAFKNYEIAAMHDVADAQFALGNMYRLGQGCTENLTEAAKWFEKGAAGHNDDAQNNLGSCYYNGEGKEPSYSAAHGWYKLAESRGNKVARINLTNLFPSS